MRRISARQREALTRLAHHLLTFRRPPSLRELGRNMGYTSTNATVAILSRLRVRKLVEQHNGQWWPTPAGWSELGFQSDAGSCRVCGAPWGERRK